MVWLLGQQEGIVFKESPRERLDLSVATHTDKI